VSYICDCSDSGNADKEEDNDDNVGKVGSGQEEDVDKEEHDFRSVIMIM
jgi:hypothetical protein